MNNIAVLSVLSRSFPTYRIPKNITWLANIKGTNRTPLQHWRWRGSNVRRGTEQRGIELRGNVQCGIVSTEHPYVHICKKTYQFET